jgi:hypothetical protein
VRKRWLAVIVVASFLVGYIACALLISVGESAPSATSGWPIVCNLDVDDCYQKGERVTPPERGKPCGPRSDSTWQQLAEDQTPPIITCGP